MRTREKFLADVEAFLTATGMAPSMFGREAVNDPAFVQRLREGIDPRTRTMDRAYEFMKQEAAKRRPLPRSRRKKAEARQAA